MHKHPLSPSILDNQRAVGGLERQIQARLFFVSRPNLARMPPRSKFCAFTAHTDPVCIAVDLRLRRYLIASVAVLPNLRARHLVRSRRRLFSLPDRRLKIARYAKSVDAL